MGITEFREIGKIKEATEHCNCKIKIDLNKGLHCIFPDGFRLNVQGLKDRSRTAIISWLNMIWAIRQDVAKKHS